MHRLLPVALLVTLPCYAQLTTGAAKTEGACSVANSGNENRIQIECGIGREQGQKMLAILNKILAEHLDADAVMSKLDEIQTGVSSISAQLQKQHEQEAAAETKRRTAPALVPFLATVAPGKVAVCIRSLNLIPYEFRYFVSNSKGTLLGGFPMSLQTVYPTDASPQFCVPDDFDWQSIPDHLINFSFTYMSLSYDELHLPGHSGQVTVKYAVAPDGKSMSPVP